MAVRGIRGATTVPRNAPGEIRSRTRELVSAMVEANGVRPRDIAAAFFTATPDLDADFPAHAARSLGREWRDVPLMCSVEIGVPGSLRRVVRVMMLVNSRRPASQIRHLYLGGTECLRPDLNGAPARRRGTRP